MSDRSGPPADLFETAYLVGTPSALAPAVPPATGAAPRTGTAAGPLPPSRVRTAPAEPVALGGQILTPDGPVPGWLLVEDGLVAGISTRRPASARAVDTDGVVLPGLVDLHGHPDFNVFPPWEPPRTYVNRYAWRASEAYRVLVRDPQNRLLRALPPGTQLRYAEIRALTGGVTAIQGAGGRGVGAEESLVRNVDRRIFGAHRARTMIDLPAGPEDRGGEQLAAILDEIARGEVTAFYVHLAEGRRDNRRSVEELDHLRALGALTAATVIIHGSALTREQLGTAADAGASLVWSPQSNLRLYGETTRAGDALDVGLPVALGADWLPSGSTSLLAEMKVARRELADQGRAVPASRLVAMVTSEAARIAGLGDRLGALEVGRPADVLVLSRAADDPYESVCAAYPTDVELVLVGGDLTYGRADWVSALAADPAHPHLEPVVAWGRRMLLDTSYTGRPSNGTSTRLAELRAALTSAYPQVGPIWA